MPPGYLVLRPPPTFRVSPAGVLGYAPAGLIAAEANTPGLIASSAARPCTVAVGSTPADLAPARGGSGAERTALRHGPLDAAALRIGSPAGESSVGRLQLDRQCPGSTLHPLAVAQRCRQTRRWPEVAASLRGVLPGCAAIEMAPTTQVLLSRTESVQGSAGSLQAMGQARPRGQTALADSAPGTAAATRLVDRLAESRWGVSIGRLDAPRVQIKAQARDDILGELHAPGRTMKETAFPAVVRLPQAANGPAVCQGLISRYLS